MSVVSLPSVDSRVRAYAPNPAPAIGGEVHVLKDDLKHQWDYKYAGSAAKF